MLPDLLFTRTSFWYNHIYSVTLITSAKSMSHKYFPNAIFRQYSEIFHFQSLNRQLPYLKTSITGWNGFFSIKINNGYRLITYFRLICRNLALRLPKSGLSWGSSDQHFSMRDVISPTCSLTFSLDTVGRSGTPLFASGPLRTISTISARKKLNFKDRWRKRIS